MVDKDEILAKLQDFLRTRPMLLIGTGLSVSMGLPGMGELTNFLKSDMPKRCVGDPKLTSEWTICLASIEAHGLEDGLGRCTVSQELLHLIIEATATVIDLKDIQFKRQLIATSAKSFPLAKLIKHIIDSLPPGNPCLNIITSNYDHLIEYACDVCSIHCCTGFSGAHLQRFSHETLVCDSYSLTVVPDKRTMKTDYRKQKRVRLLKPHGSLKWQQLGSETFQCSEMIENATRVIITPGLTKYKASLTDPTMNCHREMANQSIRSANSIMVIGYGFNDSHLQTVLTERLSQGMNCLIITRHLSDSAKMIVQDYPNIIALDQSTAGLTTWYYQGDSGEFPGQLWSIEEFVDKVVG
ncbi:SIR2 family protein [Sporomusa sp.]|uniref:SIR2 family protein n=1 Tax=Sporomusa sp. TaxID=2078658 RepID=UPI002C9CAB47|nr:SIR2 family protein [Sporomusa sp.]HWR09594.1 SIR2 family protein [Sporomusa sp.]